MALKVEKFFCLSLPKATLTIGYLTIVLGMLQALTLARRLVYFNDQEDEEFIMYDYRKMPIIELGIFICSLSILSGILLIIGTVKKSHLLLLPWLVITVPAMIAGVIFMIIILVLSIKNRTNEHLKDVLFLSVLTVVEAYTWIAVYSFSCKIREEKDRERKVQYNSQPESANAADEGCNPKHAFQRI